MEGYNLARQVENIVCGPSKKGFSTGSGFSSSRPLFLTLRVQQGMGSSPSKGGRCKVTRDKEFHLSLCPKQNWMIDKRRAFVFGVVRNTFHAISVLSPKCINLLLNQCRNKDLMLKVHHLKGLRIILNHRT